MVRDGTIDGHTAAYTMEDLWAEMTAAISVDAKAALSAFQVLLLSCQFEAALQLLLSVEEYAVHAVHFAIALYYYGLVTPTDPMEAAMGLSVWQRLVNIALSRSRSRRGAPHSYCQDPIAVCAHLGLYRFKRSLRVLVLVE